MLNRPLVYVLGFVWLLLAMSGLFPASAQNILREYWLGLPGTSIGDLTSVPAFPANPSSRVLMTNFEAPVNWADNYGTRMRGYVRPPLAGSYTFWISGDDQCQLFLSTDESPANKLLIASVQSWTSSRQWDKEPDQRSSPVALESGKRYYIEALQKEGGGGDNLAVGWQLPNGILERPIPGSRLAPYQIPTNPPVILTQPADLNLAEGEKAAFVVSANGMEPLVFQWQRDGVNLDGETTPTYLIPAVAPWDNGARFRCVVSNLLGRVISREAMLTVHPETTPPVIASLHPPPGNTVSHLTQIEVLFSEVVSGIDATDLQVNGQPATNVTGLAAGPYVFQFSSPPTGMVWFAWSTNHQIQDAAPIPNPFSGGPWTCILSPDARPADVVINEFLTSNQNTNGLKDEDLELQEWIEIYNRSSNTVNLAGWSLTDDPQEPGQWTFPAITIGARQYLVVFTSGKDRRPAMSKGPWHTNFKLNPAGEYLGLYNAESPRMAVSELSPSYPEQRTDYSFGRDATGQWRYYRLPTPGSANGYSPVSGIVGPVHFNVESGFFNGPFNLRLSSETADAEIRYSLDGREPTETAGLVYTNAIAIAKTAIVRAAAFKTNCLPSPVATHTYLINLNAAQRSLPVISLVTATNNLIGPTGIIGISGGTYVNGAWQAVKPSDYHNPSKHGFAWERPVSAEYLRPQDHQGFQADCGLRVHSSDWFRPRLRPDSKFSYRLYFRGQYGTGKLEYPLFADLAVQRFDQLVLRAGNNDPTNPFIIDELVRRLALATGQVNCRGTFVNLFVNGQYKGYYNPTERVDKNFCQAWHGGGPNWDVIAQGSQAQDGDTVAWNASRSYVSTHNLAVPAYYQEVSRRLDLVNFIDYLLVNIYAQTGDWPQNNWRAARERVAGAKFRFYIWDAEHAFGLYDVNRVNMNTFTQELAGSSEIPSLYRALKVNPEFRLLFADRVHKHFFNGGALADTNVLAQYNAMKNTLLGVIPQMNVNIPNRWIPQRRGYLLRYFAAEGVLASSNAPAFNQFGGRAPFGFPVALSATNGTIYYTIQGEDPRLAFTGEIAPAARPYTNSVPIRLETSAVIKARTLSGTVWSALSEAAFQVAAMGVPLRITEIMYNPPGGEAYEFIELQNVSSAPLDLSGMRFEGIDFAFSPGSILPGKAVLVLSSDANPAAFATRYPKSKVWGAFKGALSNGGERLVLKDRQDRIVAAVQYQDAGSWSPQADGGGYSLEIIDPAGDADDPANWRASNQIGGSPGEVVSAESLTGVQLNEIMAYNESAVVHAGNYPDWIELYNAGPQTANLSGWSLTDDGAANMFLFPKGTTLAAGQYLVVWCEARANAPGFHTGFGLKREGEHLFLSDAENRRVDAISFGQQLPDLSLGKDRQGNGSWQLTMPTPGTPNTLATVGACASLIINEWLPNPKPGEAGWLELYNLDPDNPVALRGLYVAASNALTQIQTHAFVAAGGYVRLWAEERNGPAHLGLKLPVNGGVIVLYDPTGAEINRVNYGLLSPGASQGRWPDGSENRIVFSNSASPGAPNYLPASEGPILNELMAVSYAGWGPGWIELYNPSLVAIDLSGMVLRFSPDPHAQWAFPARTRLEAGGYMILWCDEMRPYSIIPEPVLNTGRSLSADGGWIGLVNPQGQMLDTLEYGFQVAGRSIGRKDRTWGLLLHPTPGTTNAGLAALGDPYNLRINEWIADPISGQDWFELYNRDTAPVELSGLALTDDPSLAGQGKYRISPLSFIADRGWVKWIADEQPEQGPNHVNFRLDRAGELLRIYGPFQNLIDSVDFGWQPPGASLGRWPDGGTNIVVFATTPTPGYANQIDTDGDGMADSWEQVFGLNPNSQTDAASDPDEDGLTNYQEYLSGTDPRNPQSCLQIAAAYLGDGQIEIHFDAAANKSYTVQYCDSLAGGYWLIAAQVEAKPFDRQVILPDCAPANPGARFYRLLTPKLP